MRRSRGRRGALPPDLPLRRPHRRAELPDLRRRAVPVTGDANLFGNSDLRRRPQNSQVIAPRASCPATCRPTGRGRSSRPPGRWSRRTRTARSTCTSGRIGDLDGAGRAAPDLAGARHDRLEVPRREPVRRRRVLHDARPAGRHRHRQPGRPLRRARRRRHRGAEPAARVAVRGRDVPGRAVRRAVPARGGQRRREPRRPAIHGPRPSFSVARLSREQQAQLASGRRRPGAGACEPGREGQAQQPARSSAGGCARSAAASKTARRAGSRQLRREAVPRRRARVGAQGKAEGRGWP